MLKNVHCTSNFDHKVTSYYKHIKSRDLMNYYFSGIEFEYEVSERGRGNSVIHVAQVR